MSGLTVADLRTLMAHLPGEAPVAVVFRDGPVYGDFAPVARISPASSEPFVGMLALVLDADNGYFDEPFTLS